MKNERKSDGKRGVINVSRNNKFYYLMEHRKIKFSLAAQFDGERFTTLTSKLEQKMFKFLSSGEEISSLVKNITHRMENFIVNLRFEWFYFIHIKSLAREFYISFCYDDAMMTSMSISNWIKEIIFFQVTRIQVADKMLFHFQSNS